MKNKNLALKNNKIKVEKKPKNIKKPKQTSPAKALKVRFLGGVGEIGKNMTALEFGKDIIIIEDILDTGLTLSYIVDILKSRNPNSVKICTFLDKPERRKADIKADYTGVSVPDEFVVGYGLDYDEKYRNLPFVGILKPEIYS